MYYSINKWKIYRECAQWPKEPRLSNWPLSCLNIIKKNQDLYLFRLTGTLLA